MSPWYRVFAVNEVHPEPAALLAHLHGLRLAVTGRFRGDDQGWFRAELLLPEEDWAIEVDCYLATEEDVRQQLNTWAAWLETTPEGPVQDRLMLHVIGTRRVFTVHAGENAEEPPMELCLAVCRFLAAATAGVYQIDGEGFYAADGTLLVAEESCEH
jgi:hypothetical protein